MNLVQVDYLYRDQAKINDFIAHLAITDVKVEWDSQKSRIKIIWEWGQESEVKKLLDVIRERFKEPVITIDNEDCNQLQISIPKPTEVKEEANFISDVEVDKEDENSKHKLVDVQEECLLNSRQLSLINSPEPNPQEQDVAKSDEPFEEEIIDVARQIKATLDESSKLEEVEFSVIQEGNVNDSTSAVEDSIPLPPPPTPEEYENVFKELLGDKIEEYDFEEKPEDAATSFCTEYDIRSETMRIALTLVCFAPNEAEFMSGLARVRAKNVALVKAELNGCFKKWLASLYPEILEKYPDIKLIHFLNVFRDEDSKF